MPAVLCLAITLGFVRPGSGVRRFVSVRAACRDLAVLGLLLDYCHRNGMRVKKKGLQLRWDPVRKMQVPVIPEKDVVEEIVSRLWLQAKIRMVIINQPVGGKTPPNVSGIPDTIGEIPARRLVVTCLRAACGSTTVDIPPTPLYIEVKRRGGARRAAQIRFIEEKKSAGCAAFFAESWLDVIRELYPFGIKLAA